MRCSAKRIRRVFGSKKVEVSPLSYFPIFVYLHTGLTSHSPPFTSEFQCFDVILRCIAFFFVPHTSDSPRKHGQNTAMRYIWRFIPIITGFLILVLSAPNEITYPASETGMAYKMKYIQSALGENMSIQVKFFGSEFTLSASAFLMSLAALCVGMILITPSVWFILETHPPKSNL